MSAMSGKRIRAKYKNQSTQCNAFITFKDLRKDTGIQCVIDDVEKEKNSSKDSSCLNVSTQTEIFGFVVPLHKWDDINSLSNPRKRKLFVDNETCVSEDDFVLKKPAMEEPKQTSSSSGVRFPSPVTAIKSFIDSQHSDDIVQTHHKSFDGLLDHLEISHKRMLMVSSYYVSPVRLLFSSNGKLVITVLFKNPVEMDYFNFDSGTLLDDVISKSLSLITTNYVFCSGIPKGECDLVDNTKKLKKFDYPLERFQSDQCLVWYIPPDNAPKDKIQTKLYQCSNCRELKWYITARKKKLEQVTPRTKLKRQSVESKCRFSVLTPRSKKNRLLKNKRNRSSLRHKVKLLEKKLIETSLELSKEQDTKMADVVSQINLRGKKDLEDIFNAAMKKNKLIGLALKKAWASNSKAVVENDFLKDQEKAVKGSHGNSWSPLTYRIALSVFSRSPAAYEALSSFDVLKLPSIYTLRRKIGKINSKAGIDLVHLKKESERFDQFVENHPEYNMPPKEGSLIFDEVKIIGKLVWNSKSGEFLGCAMDPNEYASLDDLFKAKNVSEVLEAEYALQYLWRCTTAPFDIIGPYFLFAKPVTHAAISSTLVKCVFAFHTVKLEIGILVCDGGSSNMAVLRQSLGFTKAIEPTVNNEDGTYNFRISTKIPNWCKKGTNIYWMVCPSHQLKNMINALHHSQDNGTRDFTNNGVRFGWKQIVEMKKREDDRRDCNELVQVKGLNQSHIDRDPWTKLNVTPARIMQKMEVLGELYNYANPMFENQPKDKSSVMACFDYLQACHQIFEEGLLSQKPATGPNSAPVKSMLNGLMYFERWASERISDKERMTNNPKFLAWQTFELLRITVYGFVDYVEEFISRHPSKYIYPVRINGSAVETLFSQMKYVTAGKLSSLNYQSARRALLIKGCTKTSQNAEASYRKVGLDVCDN